MRHHFDVLSLLKTIGSFVFAAFFLFACGEKKDASKNNKSPDKQATIVDVMIAQPSIIFDTIEANGTVIANETVELHPEVVGRLIYLNVPEGKWVKEGTILARVNDADLQAQVMKSKVQLQLAEANRQRLSKLLDIQGVNQADYDAAVNLVGSLQSDIAYNTALIDKTIVRAPFSGVLGLRQVSPGAFVTNNTIIATLQQTNKIKIDFTLPEEFGNVIKVGSKVDVEIDKANGKKAKATIIAVEPQVNQQTRNLIARAILDEGSSNPGAFVKVYVRSGNDKNAILIPTNAIIPGDQSDQVILVKEGKAIMTNVQTGVRQASTAEITSGIKQNDTVIVTGVLFARPNSEVKVRSVKPLEEFVKKGLQ
ncbi:MAG: efflux RND transporter periplasmic adaptor subunit [Bacteroidota bacterium]|nr:efflux RND transporter periplasmic adaptor subunit [Bacteroidota bacterium]